MGLFLNDRSISLGVVRMYSLLNPFPIKGMYLILSLHSYSILYPEMMAVIEIDFLQGNNEQVIKEAAILADGGLLALSNPPTLSYGTTRF